MKYCSRCGTELEEVDYAGRRKKCPGCEEIAWQNPSPVAWLLVEHEGKYLLVKRDIQPDRGEWDIPGGYLELEESFQEAARRELEEETGVTVEHDIRLIDTIHHESHNVVGAVFHVELEEMPGYFAGDETEDARFWDLDELSRSDEVLRDICRQVLDPA